MSFTTMLFFVFLAVGVFIYYIIPKKMQWIWLLILSYLYYFSFSVKASIFMIVTTVTIYAAGLVLDDIQAKSKSYLAGVKETITREDKKKYKEKVKRNKRLVVAAALTVSFGILAVLKYAGFVAGSLSDLLRAFGIDAGWSAFKLIAPVGISFYTFQAVTYVVDIYQGKYASEKNLFKMALFVSFFPQILQGPIGRFDRLGHQLFEHRGYDIKNIHYGLQRIFWGLFKKLVLADRAAVLVNAVFQNPYEYHGAFLILALLMYSIQLYMDFSGGIDVVIGVAQMFGITMDENFRQPYFSKSIGEFWRRWHITLGTWMKDYIFYPFSLSKAMNRFGKWGKKHLGNHNGKVLPICLSNLLIFFIVGVWHGAEARFIVYGIYNGVIIAFSNLIEPVYHKLLKFFHINSEAGWWKAFQMFRTFILVNIGWIFDCCVLGMGEAGYTFRQIFTNWDTAQINAASLEQIGMLGRDFIILAAGCMIVLVISILKEKKVMIRDAVAARPLAVRWIIYYALFMITFILGYAGDGSAFMYAQF